MVVLCRIVRTRYGFSGLERDDEVSGSGNHYGFGGYGYSPRPGRRWNVDPKFNEIAGLSPYAYSLNNPIVYKDPDGELPILPLLLKAGAAGAADMLAQAAMTYYFDPQVETVGQAFEVVNYYQVARSAAEGLIPWRFPGGRVGKAAATASGDILVNAIMIVGQRNNLNQKARDLMSDKTKAADLDITDPIQGFDYYNNKYEGDYSEIMQGGTTSNAGVNKKLGVD